MSYQTEEQQIEQLKDWWKENGTSLLVGAALGLSGFFGWKFWNEKQVIEQESASNLYVSMTEYIGKEDASKLIENANLVKAKHPDSSYAILASFHLVKVAVEEKKYDEAAAELKWIIDNHKGNELTDIAKIRLARILIAQQKAEQALALLTFSDDSGYFELANLVKGDAFSALNKKQEALEAYQLAANVGKTTANHSTLNIKIDELKLSELELTEVAK